MTYYCTGSENYLVRDFSLSLRFRGTEYWQKLVNALITLSQGVLSC